MKPKTIIKFALLLVGIVALYNYQQVWDWVSRKTWQELTGDILGFVLKWFFLGLFGWLAITIPHYIEPWLKLLRQRGRMKIKAQRYARQRTKEPEPHLPTHENFATGLLKQLLFKNSRDMLKQNRQVQSPSDEIKLKF